MGKYMRRRIKVRRRLVAARSLRLRTETTPPVLSGPDPQRVVDLHAPSLPMRIWEWPPRGSAYEAPVIHALQLVIAFTLVVACSIGVLAGLG